MALAKTRRQYSRNKRCNTQWAGKFAGSRMPVKKPRGGWKLVIKIDGHAYAADYLVSVFRSEKCSGLHGASSRVLATRYGE